MNKESDNLCAENIFRILAASSSGFPKVSSGGAHAVESVLDRYGIDTAQVVVADGSGVSRYNLVSASVIVRTLEEAYRRHAEAFATTLSVAGVDGTLQKRMRGTAAEGTLRGKTGTFSGTSNLSGYTRTSDGELLVFSILMQNFPEGPGSYRAVQDSIGVFLSGMRRSDL
jgi:D-alanyl-D-alanine carboxypeptidase/D-alanyl-D-alanine-endopeptidase (penicillin-binding protein 4)